MQNSSSTFTAPSMTNICCFLFIFPVENVNEWSQNKSISYIAFWSVRAIEKLLFIILNDRKRYPHQHIHRHTYTHTQTQTHRHIQHVVGKWPFCESEKSQMKCVCYFVLCMLKLEILKTLSHIFTVTCFLKAIYLYIACICAFSLVWYKIYTQHNTTTILSISFCFSRSFNVIFCAVIIHCSYNDSL